MVLIKIIYINSHLRLIKTLFVAAVGCEILMDTRYSCTPLQILLRLRLAKSLFHDYLLLLCHYIVVTDLRGVYLPRYLYAKHAKTHHLPRRCSGHTLTVKLHTKTSKYQAGYHAVFFATHSRRYSCNRAFAFPYLPTQ